MSTGESLSWSRRTRFIVTAVAGVSILAALLGHPALAEVVGGGLIIFVAFITGRPLMYLVATEPDPGRKPILDVLLVLAVVLALVGVGVMAAAIPGSGVSP